VSRPVTHRTGRTVLKGLSPGQESLKPFHFEAPEFGRGGPLLDRLAIGGIFGMHFEPPALVLAGCSECGLKRGIALLIRIDH
jgi:hypothetical protein